MRVYKDSARLTEIAFVPASGRARIECEAAPMGTVFYPCFQFIVDEANGFTQDEAAITARVDAGKITEITIPRITAITTTMACVKIENQFTKYEYELRPHESASTIVMPQEDAIYAVQAGEMAGYVLIRNASDPVAFSPRLDEFQGGGVYMFRYDGSVCFLIGAEDVFGTDLSSLCFSVSTATEMEKVFALPNAGAIDIDIAQGFSLGPISLSRSGLVLTIKGGASEEKIISLSGAGSLFTVESGVTLTLEDNVALRGAV
ncbi:MAG: hypothetical protein LBL45_00355 [Treponema sp.]|nr:hypothetical protein [Treponema sp.]